MGRNIHLKRISLVTFWPSIILACMCGPGTLLATQTPTVIIPTDTPAPTEVIPTETPTVEDTHTPTEDSPVMSLQSGVPWMIISTTDSLWVANMDGTNLVPLVQKSYMEIDLQRAISSPAHKIAVLASGEDYYHNLTLQVISLPDMKVIKRN